MNLPLICPVIINFWEKYCKCPCRRTDGQYEIQMPQIFNYKLYRTYFLQSLMIPGFFLFPLISQIKLHIITENFLRGPSSS